MKASKTLGGFAAALVCSLASVTLYASDSTSYVQDGLVLQFDAIENAGRNQHDDGATVWKDLVGSRDASFYGTVSWGDKALTIKGKTGSGAGQSGTYARGSFDGTLTAAHTIEVCFKVIASSNAARILGGKGTGAEDFPQLSVSTYSGANPAKCGLRLYGYGNTGVEVKRTYAYLDLANGETVSYSQTGTPADGVDYFVNGKFYWKQTGVTTACANTGATAYLGNVEARNYGTDSEFYSVRIYNRVLTAAERAQNARVDQVRYLTGPVEILGTTYIDAVNGDDANSGHEYRNAVTGEAHTNAVRSFSKVYKDIMNNSAGITKDTDIAFVPGVHEIEDQTTGSNYQPNIVVRGATGSPKDVVLVAKGSPHRFYYAASNTSTNYLFHSLTFRGFSTTSGSGGAIYNAPGASVCDGMVISNCVFENCSAAVSGGAVYYDGRGGRLIGCTFDRCSCGGGNGGGGGGLYLDPRNADTTLIQGCVFADNFTTNVGIVANGGHGGGAFLNTRERTAPMFLKDCKFLRNHTLSGILNSANASNNFTSCGGALYGNMTRMTNCRFEGNWTDSTDPHSKTNSAGGAWNAGSTGYAGLHTVVEGCHFITNFCAGVAGAFYLWPGRTVDYGVTFSNCVFTGNSANGNGAVSFISWSGGGIRYVNFYDCLVNKNRAAPIGNANGAGYGTSGQVKSSDIICMISCASDFVRCRFEDNVGYGRSGALVIYDTDNNLGYHGAGGYRVEDCVFRNNVIAVPPIARQTLTGGALWVNGGNSTTNVIVRNCLFDGNVNSNYLGGAIVFTANNALHQCAVENCTFVNNQADLDNGPSNTDGPFGGVGFALTPVDTEIRNCLFADNHRVGDETMVRDVSHYYCNAILTNCLFKTEGKDLHPAYKVADGYRGCKVGYDPKFYDAANGDYRIVKRSPARDTGVNQPWMFAEGAHDLSITNSHGRLVPRVTGDIVDIGCYEWMPGNPPEPGMLLFVR